MFYFHIKWCDRSVSFFLSLSVSHQQFSSSLITRAFFIPLKTSYNINDRQCAIVNWKMQLFLPPLLLCHVTSSTTRMLVWYDTTEWRTEPLDQVNELIVNVDEVIDHLAPVHWGRLFVSLAIHTEYERSRKWDDVMRMLLCFMQSLPRKLLRAAIVSHSCPNSVCIIFRNKYTVTVA